VILEVMAWVPAFTDAFTSVSGGRTRLEDLHVSVAACLTAQALNIGYAPVAKRGVPALEPDRLAHVSGAYLSAETFSLANAPLIDAQAGIPFARALGGGLVAAIDGMRFVVPVPSVYARPSRKYFGPKRGVTWLNMINDQAAGLGGKVVAGTVRDSLHMIDVLFNQDGGQRPDIVVSDTGSYVVTWTPVVPQAPLGAGFSQFAPARWDTVPGGVGAGLQAASGERDGPC
jgi:Tn3 transposase DDE domain